MHNFTVTIVFSYICSVIKGLEIQFQDNIIY